MGIDFYSIVKAFVLPPGASAAAGLLGLMLYVRWHRTGLGLLGAAALSIWIFSMPATAGKFAGALETIPPFELDQLSGRSVDAIVILGGGGYQDAPEFDGLDDVSRLTLERLRYGARLHRATGIEIAVTGGAPGDLGTPEGEMMRAVLEGDFGVSVRWVETESNNTAENAMHSRERFSFDTIILVTHAMHMPRALRAFEGAGFDPIPAPLGFVSRPGSKTEPGDFLPSMKALMGTRYAMYELLGAVWYRWRYG